MFANGTLATSSGAEVDVIPTTAIVEEGGQSFVYVVKDGKVERRSVVLEVEPLDAGSGLVREFHEGNARTLQRFLVAYRAVAKHAYVPRVIESNSFAVLQQVTEMVVVDAQTLRYGAGPALAMAWPAMVPAVGSSLTGALMPERCGWPTPTNHANPHPATRRICRGGRPTP